VIRLVRFDWLRITVIWLRHRIRSLSDSTELIVVMAVGFGYFAIESLLRLLRINAAPMFVALPLHQLSVYQIVLLVLIWAFLAMRGWRLPDLGESPRVVDVPIGIALAVGAYIPFLLLWWLLLAMSQSTGVAAEGLPTPLDLSDLDFKTILTGALINSVFEEVLVVGYLMNAVRKRFGAGAAVHVSALVRLSYHAHLGVAAILSILPLGYVFAFWYRRRRSLLPLITAHTILDVVAFSLYRLA
jgi:membrane protease YdiL (CAAX protease family)